MHLAVQPASQLIFLNFQIITRLQVHPEILGHPKITGQSQDGISGDGTFAMYDFINTTRRNVDILRLSLLAESHWFQEFFQ